MRQKIVSRTSIAVLLALSSFGVSVARAPAAAADPAAEAARVAPGMPLDVVIANDASFRQEMGFRADKAYVRWLYAHPDRTTGTRDAGALLTPAEAKEEHVRTIELPRDVEAIDRWLRAHGYGDAIGGVFIDHQAGGKVTTLLTRSVEGARASLLKVVRHPERLVVRAAAVTEAALNDALDSIHYAPIVALTGPVLVAAVDVPNNRLVMVVKDPATANRMSAGASTGVPVLFVSGSSVVDQSDRNNDAATPPYRGGHGILLMSSTSGGGWAGGCTLGFAARNRSGADAAITAAHCMGTSHSSIYVFHNDSRPVYIGNGAGGYYGDGGAVDYYAYSAVSGRTTSPTVFTTWPSTQKVYSTDEGHEKVGYNRHKSGRTSGYGTGPLAYLNIDIDGSGSKFSYGWRAASYYSLAGDSGMPVWHPLNGYAWASGIHYGIITISGKTYGVYCHIRNVLNASGFSLKTTT